MAIPDQGSRSAVAVSIFLGFVAAFVVALVEFRGAHIIGRFAVRWELARAASLFAAWMPSLLFAACAAAMSLHREQGLRFAELIRPVLLPALILALLLAALEITVLPGVRRMQGSYESLSGLFRSALSEAEEALKAEDIPRAQERIALCGSIDSTEASYKALKERVQRAFLKSEQGAESDKPDGRTTAKAPDTGYSAYELYKRALVYFQKGDFYSAHWYSGKALLLDPGRRDAKKLQAEAWERIQSSVEDPADKERAAFHARKAQGYALLQAEDYLGAYRVFTDLSREAPDDPDVIRYRKESSGRLAQAVFFADDYRRAFAGGSVGNFAVKVSSGDIDHIVFASRIVRSGFFLYIEGFEYMKSSPDGPVLHVTAPFARLQGAAARGEPEGGPGALPSCSVLLRRVERDAPGEISQQQYHVGKAGPPGDAVLDVPMDFEALSALLDLRDDASRVSFPLLLTGSRIAETYGWNPGLYRREIALRISMPIVFVILVLLGTSVGARFRRDEEPGRARMILTLPVLAILASVPLSAANRAGGYLLSRLFDVLPASGAIGIWISFLAALLVVSLLTVGRLGVHASE